MTRRYRHKRGGLYTLIKRRPAPYNIKAGERVLMTVDGFLCFATATDDIPKDQEAVFYVGDDSRGWVRPAALFDEPGRFTPVEEIACP